MKSFSITSDKFTGEIILTYNDAFLLTTIQLNAELTEGQHIWFLKNLPREIIELEEMKKKSTTVNVIEIPVEITFEMFWSKYDEKIRSSKKRALLKWNRMTRADQIRAYNFIDNYNRIRGNAEKKYAETYLGAEMWNNQ